MFCGLTDSDNGIVFRGLIFVTDVLTFMGCVFFNAGLNIVSPALRCMSNVAFSMTRVKVGFNMLLKLTLLNCVLIGH